MQSGLDKLVESLADKRRIWILTGAGISQPSGIPTYRDHEGQWQAGQPIQHQEFIHHREARQRYWARSAIGWQYMAKAEPNNAHRAITKLQQTGLIKQIVTQNVDRLHSLAGAVDVIDLHGRIDEVICLDCNVTSSRADHQLRLLESNPQLANFTAADLPDGDARLENFNVSQVSIPACQHCQGTLMPNVVFFGGAVPKKIVKLAFDTLSRADAVLAVGTSLTVYSGFRFAREAHLQEIPLYAVNQGIIRGAEMFTQLLPLDCETALPYLAEKLTAGYDLHLPPTNNVRSCSDST